MNTVRSHDLFTRAQALMPGGVNSPVRAFKSVGGEPFFVQRADGPYLFDADGKLAVGVVKGAQGDHQVDSLAGATLTSNGVHNLLQFWLGQSGFGPFIAHLRAGEA